jgi:hypothetical protein
MTASIAKTSDVRTYEPAQPLGGAHASVPVSVDAHYISSQETPAVHAYGGQPMQRSSCPLLR